MSVFLGCCEVQFGVLDGDHAVEVMPGEAEEGPRQGLASAWIQYALSATRILGATLPFFLLRPLAGPCAIAFL